jgi:hypothetical protein
MPSYSFVCLHCNENLELFLSIPEYLELKKGKVKCKVCDTGFISQKIVSIAATVEKSTDQLILEIQDEVRKTVNKIGKGDHRAIEDVYGDRTNPYKNTGGV